MIKDTHFRGVSIEEENKGEWVRGYYLRTAQGDDMIVVIDTATEDERRYRVDPNSLGQYLGLQDIDGNNIYTNSIIVHMNMDMRTKTLYPTYYRMKEARYSLLEYPKSKAQMNKVIGNTTMTEEQLQAIKPPRSGRKARTI